MQNVIILTVFVFGAYCVNLDYWLFQIISFLWYVWTGAVIMMHIFMLPNEAIKDFVVEARKRAPNLNMKRFIVTAMLKWLLAFLFGHIYIAPIALALEFINSFRIMIKLQKNNT